jgi:DNA-binding CsgD family transcriptional regulator
MAGDPQRARALGVEICEVAPSGPLRARALYLRALTHATQGPRETIELLAEAVAGAVGDRELEAELETSLSWALIESFDLRAASDHLARAAELAKQLDDRNLLAQAMALQALHGLEIGQGVDEEALEEALRLEDPDQPVPFLRLPSLIVAQVFASIGRPDRAQVLLADLHARLAARGEESALAYVTAHEATTAFMAGALEETEKHATDAIRMAMLTGQELMTLVAQPTRAVARAFRGDGSGSSTDATEAFARSNQVGWPPGIASSRLALAIIALVDDDAPAAVTWLDPVVAQVEQIGVFEFQFAMAIPNAIEALIATGDVHRAARLTDSLEELGKRNDRPWALALAGRSRALLWAAGGELDRAQDAAEQAVVEHARLPMPLELGRTLLALGQLQRRRGERRAARETLQRAEAIFDAAGATAWTIKTRAEANRIGVRRAPAELTDGERLTARFAADGLTNREIAARTFMSTRTVEANLSRAYRKLGVRSRAELAGRMAREESAPSA